ncbi:MAG: hypothetical protein K6T81_18940 [Alicyclobacillus macrosporangiidus]|uniref:hypothetical protein n=1 Tax=Alicyclobacillus macrosporangiidus TaxID=392015 RepID=UPI0026F26245|nr:hypothetical protein [Alicyclobacillus macrosporangiidus]MCL6600788.1 hypothetical protein [Alicyclobacillus macrosporangiidus]
MHRPHTRYIQLTVTTQNGPVTLTVFSPLDALWICEQIRRLPDNLHCVQSGVVNIGDSFIVLEREPCSEGLHFLAHCYRPTDALRRGEDDSPPQLDVHAYHLSAGS